MDNDKRLKARQRIKQSTKANGRDAEIKLVECEVAKRQATGKKFCQNKFHGFVADDLICRACSDNWNCENDTFRRFLTIADQLQKIFYLDEDCFEPDYWSMGQFNIADREVYLSLDEMRECIANYVSQVKGEIDENPENYCKISEIPQLTNKTLDAIVPGWKDFRQQKPKLDPVTIFSGLAGIWNDTRDEVLELVYGQNEGDVHEAWSEILESDDYYNQSRKQIVTGLHKQLLEYCEQLKETFPAEFGRAKKDEKYWPAKWMTNDKGIRAMLNRYEHFSSILNIMWRTRKQLDYQGSLNLSRKLGIDETAICLDANLKERCCALLPENLTHEAIAKELGKSAQLVQKYLKAMCGIGVIQKFDQKGPNSYTVYSIGYWFEWKINTYRVMPYLQQKKYGKKESPEMYQKLIDFKVAFNAGQ